MSTRNISWR